MVIQSESHRGFNSGYQMQASQYASSQGGYGGNSHAHHIGHAPYMNSSGVLLGGGPLGGGHGYTMSSGSDRFSLHDASAGNHQSYTNYETSKYSNGVQPHLHGYGSSSYGSSAAYQGSPMGGNRLESSSFSYTNSGRPAHTPHQESWSFKSIDD